VALSNALAQRGGWVEGDLVDFGDGGVGVLCGVYFPKGCRLEAEFHGLDGRDKPALLSVMLLVQRVVMTDRRPAYLIGGAFVDPDAIARAAIREIARRLGAAEEVGDA
jgi:hypothetical protein